MTHAKESSGGTTRLPANSFAFRLYSGYDGKVYQVIGPATLAGRVIITCVSEEMPWDPDVQISWLRGSARALADALFAEVANAGS